MVLAGLMCSFTMLVELHTISNVHFSAETTENILKPRKKMKKLQKLLKMHHRINVSFLIIAKLEQSSHSLAACLLPSSSLQAGGEQM